MARQIIIDTDPGCDDGVAILLALASPELEVLALVAVAGNLPLATTERNARAIVELAGRPDIAVYAGCPRPLGPPRVRASQIHGDGGLGALILPEPQAPLRPEHGVAFLIDAVCRAPPHSVTLCSLGPLTNIATALVMAPDIAERAAGLVIMGGSSQNSGNVSPVAEFNMYVDPHAAALVFDSGLPITLVPLDLTTQVLSTSARIDAVRALPNRCGPAAALLMQRETPSGSVMPLHDPCVIASLIAPEMFAGSAANVAVETASPLAFGMTVIDRRGVSGRPVNARVLHEVDVEGFYRLLTARLAGLP